jgi:outer membrane protein
VKKLPCVLLVSVLLFGVTATQAQSQRIGYVNSSKIFQELPAAQEAQKRIDAISKPLQDSLEAMQKELQSRYEDYQKKEGLMNDATKKSEQQRLVEMERRYNEFRLEKFGQDGAVAKETEKIITPIRERIKTAIGQVAREEKYNFIFDKTEQIQILLYGDPTHDMTFKVIDKLKRGK